MKIKISRSLFIIILICNQCFIWADTSERPKLVLSMIMKNEAGRKLRECLEEVNHYIDRAVIIDDASTDESVKIAYEILGKKLILVHNKESKFSNEIELRKQQWEETIKTDPEWILNIDADHVWEKRMREAIYELINQDVVDVWCFRLYDFWDETHYRDDHIWCAHNTFRSFLIRYKKDFNYIWRETPQHCGHFPQNIYQQRVGTCAIRLKHYGWANENDRLAKLQRYYDIDPECKYGWPAQMKSVLDPHPHLVKWIE